MSRRSHSPSASPRSTKRARIDHLTSEDFKNGIVLAPMVRSGALPTRLFALKHGAKLVWGPEMVDKAILHSERVVDPVTGVVSYNGKSRAIFTTHPIEKPYLIYQIGSADPELAVQAALTVKDDVSGVDLNCGCPKPFSTHAGMGAALLTNPDLLCSILTALRKALPPEITVSAKIRLLPSQEDTLKLVERIVGTGISALTVHCRTRNMRDKDKALPERLKDIVELAKKLNPNIAVIENGDCIGVEDAARIRELTGADSVMIARAAESNPSIFAKEPLQDVEKSLIPSYLRLSQYLGNHWTLTKFCALQFTAPRLTMTKSEAVDFKNSLAKSKGFEDVESVVGDWTGEQEMKKIIEVIEARPPRVRTEISADEGAEGSTIGVQANVTSEEGETSTRASSETAPTIKTPSPVEEETDTHVTEGYITPVGTQDPEMLKNLGERAPLFPEHENLRPVPAAVSGIDPVTPTPTPAPAPAHVSKVQALV